MKEALFPLRTVVRETGLSAHVLRAWERRYQAVRPARSPSGQRRYTENDLQRLLLLKRATQSGHSIGAIVGQPDAAIRRFLANPTFSTVWSGDLPEQESHADCLAAVRTMNEQSLIRALDAAIVRFGHQGLLCRIVPPLGEKIGDLWRRGEITAAHEHFFTAVVRTFLGRTGQQFVPANDAPVLIAATPLGQHHELGAFMAAVMGAHLGWRVIYLGACLPAAEIAAAVIQSEAQALALSLIHPTDDPRIAAELRAIRRRLPEVNLFVGGNAAPSYRGVIRGIKAQLVSDLARFGELLDVIRARPYRVKNGARDRRHNPRDTRTSLKSFS